MKKGWRTPFSFKITPRRARRTGPQALFVGSLAQKRSFSTSCSASAENRTQKDKDKARQPLGAMFQRAAVLYRVKINFEFTLKRVKSLPTPILLYGAFCGFYTGSLLQHSVCCPFRKTHERRLQHHAVLKNRDLSVSFLLGAGLFPGATSSTSAYSAAARFPMLLRTVCLSCPR